MKLEKGLYLLTKSFQGGQTKVLVKVTKQVIDCFGDWDRLFEHVGENTNGGHCYGYRINAEPISQKPKGMKLFRF